MLPNTNCGGTTIKISLQHHSTSTKMTVINKGNDDKCGGDEESRISTDHW